MFKDTAFKAHFCTRVIFNCVRFNIKIVGFVIGVSPFENARFRITFFFCSFEMIARYKSCPCMALERCTLDINSTFVYLANSIFVKFVIDTDMKS